MHYVCFFSLTLFLLIETLQWKFEFYDCSNEHQGLIETIYIKFNDDLTLIKNYNEVSINAAVDMNPELLEISPPRLGLHNLFTTLQNITFSRLYNDFKDYDGENDIP